MLACIEPDLRVAGAHFEAVDRLAFEAGAEATIGHAFAFGDRGDQIVVAFHRVRREIGDIEDRALGGVLDRQRARVIAGVEPEPIFTVIASAGGIARPAVGIGRFGQPGDREFERVADAARNAKVEPLEKVRFAILANRKARRRAVDIFHDDIAAVESGVDADGHLTLIVRPDSPGKSLNRASANFAAARLGWLAGALTGTAVSARPSHKAWPVAALSMRTNS